MSVEAYVEMQHQRGKVSSLGNTSSVDIRSPEQRHYRTSTCTRTEEVLPNSASRNCAGERASGTKTVGHNERTNLLNLICVYNSSTLGGICFSIHQPNLHTFDDESSVESMTMCCLFLFSKHVNALNPRILLYTASMHICTPKGAATHTR